MEHRQLFFSICGEHTEVNPAESYPVHGSDMQRRRSAARLQQKAKALETEIRIGQERVQLLQQVTRAGTWELDIVNDTFSFSSAAAKLLGFTSASRVRLGQLMDLMYYSGDREDVFAMLQAAQRHRKDFKATFRVRHGDGTRIVAMQGKTFYNSGSPLMLGVVSDVTPAAEHNAAPAPLDCSRQKSRACKLVNYRKRPFAVAAAIVSEEEKRAESLFTPRAFMAAPYRRSPLAGR